MTCRCGKLPREEVGIPIGEMVFPGHGQQTSEFGAGHQPGQQTNTCRLPAQYVDFRQDRSGV